MLADDDIKLLPPQLRKSVLEMERRAHTAETRAKRAELEVQHLRLLLRLERIAKYGPASERLSDAQLELLDLEPGVHPQEVLLEAQQEVPLDAVLSETGKELPKQPVARGEKPRRGGQSLPPHLPREEILIPCHDQDCLCQSCGGKRTVIGYEETERLHRIPARYIVQVFKREKRACGECEENGVATAPLPSFIIHKGIASNELVVDTLLAKYELHQPLYRQELQMEREGGALISRSTLCDWMMECGFLLTAVSQEMHREIIQSGYLQADETPIGVQNRAVQGRNHRGYLWQYGHPHGSVIFDYRDGRGREGPQTILRDFRGVLQSDAYIVYAQLRLPGVILAACMAHVRRKFKEAADVEPSNGTLLGILGNIAALYQVEERARQDKLTWEQRARLRQEQSQPRLRELKAQIIALRQKVLPKSLTGRACDYALGVWSKLEVYLERGEVEIDNNPAERSIRPVAIGRKNWLHFGSKEAGPRIAAILSVVETCHRLRISARAYLLEVLPRLATGQRSEVAKLTPAAWATTRQSC